MYILHTQLFNVCQYLASEKLNRKKDTLKFKIIKSKHIRIHICRYFIFKTHLSCDGKTASGEGGSRNYHYIYNNMPYIKHLQRFTASAFTFMKTRVKLHNRESLL